MSMLTNNIKIFLKLKYIYAYLAIGYLLMPFIMKSQYDNILSMIGFFGCLILFYQEHTLGYIKEIRRRRR